MFIYDLIYRVCKERSRIERKKAAQRAAVEAGVAAAVLSAVGIMVMTRSGRRVLEKLINKAAHASGVLEENVSKTVSTIKHAGETAFNDAREDIEDIQNTAEQIIEDITDCTKAVAEDTPAAVKNISDDLIPE